MGRQSELFLIGVSAVLALFGREFIPLVVYAFDDIFVGWLISFLLVSAWALMFKYGNKANDERKRAEFYRERCDQLERENATLKAAKEGEHRERKA